MYSTIKNYYRHGISREQTESQALTIDPEAETVLLKVFYPDGLDSKLTEATELAGDRASETTEKAIAFAPEQQPNQNCSIENNIALLEQEIDRLGRTVNRATEKAPNLLNGQFDRGMDNLQAQAEHINGLSAQLEAEILKFKKMAKKVNRDYHAIQDTSPEAKLNSPQNYPQSDRTRPANIWAIRSCAIPIVIKQGNRLILTTKQVLQVAEDSAEQRVKKAQQRRTALECWLEAKRQRIVEDFSRP